MQGKTEASPPINEVRMLQHVGKFAHTTRNAGPEFTRLARDIFEIDGPSGRHYCIASTPQGSSLRAVQEAFPNSVLPKYLVKSHIHRLMVSLNWLHADCSTIHTGMLDHAGNLDITLIT